MSEPATRPADYVVTLMSKAAAVCQQDPFLHGRLVELPKEGDVLIAGDLHGNAPNFQRIIRAADLPRHPKRHVILQEVLHTMYADTPDRSFQLLEEVAIFKTVYPTQVHIILSNHDISELCRQEIMKQGRSTLKAFDEALKEAYQFNADVVRQAYFKFLRSFPWAAATQTGLFVCHSVPDIKHMEDFSRELFTDPGPEPNIDRGSPIFRLVWGRDLSPHASSEFARRVGARLLITGHHPCVNGHTEPNRWLVIIDSKDARGAYMLLPLDAELSQADVVSRIKFLHF